MDKSIWESEGFEVTQERAIDFIVRIGSIAFLRHVQVAELHEEDLELEVKQLDKYDVSVKFQGEEVYNSATGVGVSDTSLDEMETTPWLIAWIQLTDRMKVTLKEDYECDYDDEVMAEFNREFNAKSLTEMRKTSNDSICPRCRKPGKPERMVLFDPKGSPEYIYTYPCGTAFNSTLGKFNEIKCEAMRIGPEEALKEAMMVHECILNPKLDQYSHGMPVYGESLPKLVNVKYLLWDAELLLSVREKAQSFVDTVGEFTKSMSLIWIIDPAIVDNTSGDMVLGEAIEADHSGIDGLRLMQSLQGWPQAAPYIERVFCYRWGEPVKNLDQAQLLAVYTWLQQPYVTQAEGVHYSRQVRRAAERRNEKLNNISVIEFRRPESRKITETSAPSEECEGPRRELHCCYERVGFTRQQPYGPKSSMRKTIWIAPTLVGDPKKPFKTKSQRLYKVSK